MHEFEIIKKYFYQIAKKNKSALSLNDDVFFDKNKGLVISIDTYNQGIHFLNFNQPDLVIKKILRSSISDLVCKGVEPKYYFISGSGNKKSFSRSNLLRISKSLVQEQKKFNIILCGGDTTFSNNLSFSITSVGFSKKIVYRNKSKLHDNIYVTGNLGDSFVGLEILKKRISLKKRINNFFIKKYFQPNIQITLSKKLLEFANSSIDISDGLLADLEKMINNQKLSYKLDESLIPISRNLSKVIKDNKYQKLRLVSSGDDYQVLFTASPNKSRIIAKTSKTLGIKITKIGKIISGNNKNILIDQKGKKIVIKTKGYVHKF
tara:strand:+ start:1359 stop:2318 length:960 start_codon:yes stop_codon:yes gene_type:complete